MIVGKATTNAKLHASSQTVNIFFTKPTLKTHITKDIMPDINNAIKKEKMILYCLLGIIEKAHSVIVQPIIEMYFSYS